MTAPIKEERSLQADTFLPPEINVAVFGGPTSIGTYLENSMGAYPLRLSFTVDNFANDVSDNLNYFSTCTQTVIGRFNNKIYDLIILEYWVRYYQGLFHLVRRLRGRYPHAIIVIIKIWSPAQFRRRSEMTRSKPHSFNQWIRLQGLNVSSPIEDLQSALDSDVDGEWTFPQTPNADAAIVETAKRYDAYIYSLPYSGLDAKATLKQYLSFFDQKEHAELNEWGQVAMARNLRKFFHAIVPDVDFQIKRRYLGTWGNGDACTTWYSSGELPGLYSKSTLKMTELENEEGEKVYALEVTAPGWFDIINPFGQERTLYLSFLSSRNRKVYPPVVAQWGENWVTVDPIAQRLCRSRTIPVGKLGPERKHRVVLMPPVGSNTTHHFRLIGFLLTDEVATPREFTFGSSKGREPTEEEIIDAEDQIYESMNME